MRTDKGQAMLEFAVGVFAIALIISSILVFGRAIPEVSRHLSLVRVKAGRDAQSAVDGASAGSMPQALSAAVSGSAAPSEPSPLRKETLSFEINVEDVSAMRLLGFSRLHMSESAAIPVMTIPRPMRTGEAAE